VARKDFPPNSLKELVAWMKERPKGATFGSVGLAVRQGLGTDFGNKIGIEYQFVPYRGAAATIQDLLGDRSILPASKPPTSWRISTAAR